MLAVPQLFTCGLANLALSRPADGPAPATRPTVLFARDVDPQLDDKFVGMYVNERTLDYGPDGREAIRRLLDMGHKAGIIPRETRVEFVG